MDGAELAAFTMADWLVDGSAALMVKVRLLVAPVAWVTATAAVPAAATADDGTAALNWVELRNVVVNAVPFHRIAASLEKLVPVAVRVNAPLPAVTEAGLRLNSAGPGGMMVKGDVLESALGGSTTATTAVPADAISDAGMEAVNCIALP